MQQGEAPMFLKTTQDGSLMEVLDLQQLFDPFAKRVLGRLHAGEELQDAEPFAKSDLLFPSGEALPRCWVDADYPRS
jgi:hypothetical protein